jgi:adenine-specific DNA-methyltransferase
MEKYQLPPEYDTAEFQKFVEMFPRFWKESYFDFDEFKAYISGIVPDDLQEKYSFTWHGKTESYRLLKKNSHGTLRPCKEDSVNWDTTQNLYIEGDNLEVLKLIKHSYTAERGVKMIYIDPPYNTGEDFIYDDNFMDSLDKYLEYTNQKDIALPETSGRYHTKWLNMMYPRLWLANYLLRVDGVIFISIDVRVVANLRKL